MSENERPKSMDETKSETTPVRDPTELERIGEAFKKIGRALSDLPDDAARVRVLRATAILFGVQLEDRPR